MKEVSKRSGIIAGGNFIVDSVQMIDHWPDEEGLALVDGQASLSNGGGPYNVLSDLARLGADFPLTAVGRIGEGEFGNWILKDCSSKNIETNRLIVTPGSATSYTHVMTDKQSGRRTFFHNKGANSHLKAEDFDFSECNARFFYLGYLLLLDQLDAIQNDNKPAAWDVLERARNSGLTTVLDCVSENSDLFQSVVRPVLPQVDILCASDFEAE
jgi:sugar/nucleoside kinase (ribokinase family)